MRFDRSIDPLEWSPPAPPAPLWPAETPTLRAGRVHEAGAAVGDDGAPGRVTAATRAFAAMAVGAQGPRGGVVWIRRGRPGETGAEALDPYGLSAFFDPARLLEVAAATPIEALWAMEEALRSGAASVVVAEPGRSLDLTTSRRLQLAAEAGGSLGLSLAPEATPPRSSAVETRWRVGPSPRAEARAGVTAVWRWELLKNKRGPTGAWRVVLGSSGRAAASERAA